MIQVGTIVKITDATGITLGQCIKVLGSSKKRIAYIGEVILISVKRINLRKLIEMKAYRRKRYLKGTIHRAMVIRTKVNFCRFSGLFVRFNENSVIIINSKMVPLSTRIYGPVLQELCMR